jgi:L-2-hydroxyglutarate oxidase LhgO
MDRVDCIVVGAGVVGLAVACRLAQRGLQPLVLEAEHGFGLGISSRNSEVLHAGLYYPPGSLKAELCLRGRQLLAEYAASRGVALERCGKFVVACEPAQIDGLLALQANALACGQMEFQMLSAAAAIQAEPQLRCAAALHSPGTAIVDSHALMLALLADLERAGGQLVTGSPVVAGRWTSDGVELQVGGESRAEISAGLLVNCAGLQAPALAMAITGVPAGQLPRQHLAKGSYFSLSGRSPFRRLIYPLPEPGGLGVHLSLDLAGQARFGPDVEWVQELDYRVDPARAPAFYASIRRYWPALPDGALQPAYAGIRPKLSGPGEPAADFHIERHAPGLIHLFGIESPGLTAALAIAERVAELL